MYAISIKDINQLELLNTFMPFKDHLNNENHWILLAAGIDWAGFERSYS